MRVHIDRLQLTLWGESADPAALARQVGEQLAQDLSRRAVPGTVDGVAVSLPEHADAAGMARAVGDEIEAAEGV